MLRTNWKPAQVQGLKESRLTIRGDEDQDLVSCEEFPIRKLENCLDL